MATKTTTTKSADSTPSKDKNKSVGYFYWTGNVPLDEVMAEYGLPMDSDSLERCRDDLENSLNEDNSDCGTIYRVTVEKVLIGTRPPVVFEKV